MLNADRLNKDAKRMLNADWLNGVIKVLYVIPAIYAADKQHDLC